MSETVTVKSIDGEGNPWQHGITYWPVTFNRNGQDFSCSWGKKGDAPTVGEQVEGDFTQRNGEWKFKKASAPPPSGGTSSAGGQNHGGKRDWKPESELDPEKVARITRAHSQEMAVRLLAPRPDFNEAPKAQRQQAVKAWADWFDEDIQQAAAGAKVQAGLDRTEVPAVRPAAADGEVVDGDGDSVLMAASHDPSVDAEFTGSLTITEDGQLLPTRNQFGAVTDRFGVYREPQDERDLDAEWNRELPR